MTGRGPRSDATAGGPQPPVGPVVTGQPVPSDPAVTDDEATSLARYYDLDLADDPGDLDLYLALADRVGDPVFELACGTGRLAVPLAAAGHTVVGLDRDAAMLSRAGERWKAVQAVPAEAGGVRDVGTRGSLELVEGDLFSAEIGARHALVLLALNTLLMLGDATRLVRALEVMARHLRPGGLAVVDVWLPGADDLALFDGRVVHEWRRHDDATGDLVAKQASGRYDAAVRQIELDTWFDAWPAGGGPVIRHARHDVIQLVSADELRSAAAAAGMRIDQLGRNYALDPFGPGADRVVLVAGLV